ncbi:MAG: hypothetical protein PVH76_07365 [Myxococcales bacterium]|jgi:hypothetical protein
MRSDGTWSLFTVIAAGLIGMSSACHTIANPNDPDRQARIDNCLKQCDGSTAARTNTAYPPAPSERNDIRTACERRCHAIP